MIDGETYFYRINTEIGGIEITSGVYDLLNQNISRLSTESSNNGNLPIDLPLGNHTVSLVLPASQILGLGGSPFSGALLTHSQAVAVPNNIVTNLPWDTVVYDNGGWYDSGNPDLFTVPSGITHIVLRANVFMTATINGALRVVVFRKNSSFVNFIGGGNLQSVPASFGKEPLSSAKVPVAAGDDFRVAVSQNSGGTQNFQGFGPFPNAHFFSIEGFSHVS
jgi:hypothetical protein